MMKKADIATVVLILAVLIVPMVVFIVFDKFDSMDKSVITEQGDSKKIVEKFIHAVINKDISTAKSLLSDGVYYNRPNDIGKSIRTLEEQRKDEAVINVMNKTLKRDVSMTISNIEEIDKNRVRVKGTLTNFITSLIGLSGGMRFEDIYQLRDGKIISIVSSVNKDDEARLKERVSGRIGLNVIQREEGFLVSECSENLPAWRAGLIPGDIIVAIDGVSIFQMKYGIDEFILRSGGPSGSKVNYTVKRNGKPELINIEVEREGK